jgi:ADP-heptose:LPS heptosyltransferase
MQKLGDVLHSAVLIQRIRQMHPKAQISLLINDEANVIDGLLPEVDSILVFPRTLLQRQLTGQSNHLALPFHQLKSFYQILKNNDLQNILNPKLID